MCACDVLREGGSQQTLAVGADTALAVQPCVAESYQPSVVATSFLRFKLLLLQVSCVGQPWLKLSQRWAAMLEAWLPQALLLCGLRWVAQQEHASADGPLCADVLVLCATGQ